MGKPDLNRPISTDITSDEDKGKKEKIITFWKLGGKGEKKKWKF